MIGYNGKQGINGIMMEKGWSEGYMNLYTYTLSQVKSVLVS